MADNGALGVGETEDNDYENAIGNASEYLDFEIGYIESLSWQIPGAEYEETPEVVEYQFERLKAMEGYIHDEQKKMRNRSDEILNSIDCKQLDERIVEKRNEAAEVLKSVNLVIRKQENKIRASNGVLLADAFVKKIDEMRNWIQISEAKIKKVSDSDEALLTLRIILRKFEANSETMSNLKNEVSRELLEDASGERLEEIPPRSLDKNNLVEIAYSDFKSSLTSFRIVVSKKRNAILSDYKAHEYLNPDFSYRVELTDLMLDEIDVHTAWMNEVENHLSFTSFAGDSPTIAEIESAGAEHNEKVTKLWEFNDTVKEFHSYAELYFRDNDRLSRNDIIKGNEFFKRHDAIEMKEMQGREDRIEALRMCRAIRFIKEVRLIFDQFDQFHEVFRDLKIADIGNDECSIVALKQTLEQISFILREIVPERFWSEEDFCRSLPRVSVANMDESNIGDIHRQILSYESTPRIANGALPENNGNVQRPTPYKTLIRIFDDQPTLNSYEHIFVSELQNAWPIIAVRNLTRNLAIRRVLNFLYVAHGRDMYRLNEAESTLNEVSMQNAFNKIVDLISNLEENPNRVTMVPEHFAATKTRVETELNRIALIADEDNSVLTVTDVVNLVIRWTAIEEDYNLKNNDLHFDMDDVQSNGPSTSQNATQQDPTPDASIQSDIRKRLRSSTKVANERASVLSKRAKDMK